MRAEEKVRAHRNCVRTQTKDRKMHCKETTFSHAAQDAAETFAASLETIGLVLADGWSGEGSLFEGDGSRCEGWYWAWEARQSFSVVCCDFTLKECLPFRFDFDRYFAVRRERHGLMPQASVSVFSGDDAEDQLDSPAPRGEVFVYGDRVLRRLLPKRFRGEDRQGAEAVGDQPERP